MRGSRPQRRISLVWLVLAAAALAVGFLVFRPTTPASVTIGLPATGHQVSAPASHSVSPSGHLPATPKPSPKATGVVGTGHCAGIHEPVIGFDPGHSPRTVTETDPKTGLQVVDGPSTSWEIQEVFQVARQAEKRLRADCYQVRMTKPDTPGGWNTDVGLLRRVHILAGDHVALAVSIHDDHDHEWGAFGQIYVQKDVNPADSNLPGYPYGDLYRVNFGSIRHVTMFDTVGKATALRVGPVSAHYGEIFRRTLTSKLGNAFSVVDENFAGRAPYVPGNIPMVQLFSPVPWVYVEVGGGVGHGLTPNQITAYANGLVASVEAAVPLPAP